MIGDHWPTSVCPSNACKRQTLSTSFRSATCPRSNDPTVRPHESSYREQCEGLELLCVFRTNLQLPWYFPGRLSRRELLINHARLENKTSVCHQFVFLFSQVVYSMRDVTVGAQRFEFTCFKFVQHHIFRILIFIFFLSWWRDSTMTFADPLHTQCMWAFSRSNCFRLS